MAIALDSVTNGSMAGAGASATLPIAHTCGAGTTILIVAIAFNDGGQNGHQTTSVDYNGTSLTQLGKADSLLDTRAEFWYLLAPTTGSSLNVNIKYDFINYVGAGVMSFTGTKTTAPTIFSTLIGTASSVSHAITTVDDNSWILDVLSCETSPTISNTGSPTQTAVWNNTNQSFQWGQGSSKGPVTPAASTTLGWTSISGNTWSYVQMIMSPAATASTVKQLSALGVG